MKLFYHLFTYLLVGIVLLIGSIEYISFREEVQQFEQDMRENGAHNGKSLSGIISREWREHGEQAALRLLNESTDGYTVRVRWVWIDQLSSFTVEKERLSLQKIAHLQDGVTTSLIRNDANRVRHLYTYVPVDVGTPRQGVLELKQALTPLSSFTHRMIQRMLLISSLFATVSGVVLFYFINLKIRIPLTRLIERTRRIASGDLSAEKYIDGNDELAAMGQTLNDLCASLSIAKEKIRFEYDARLKTLDQLRHTERLSTFGLISAGIAHEIGTPLNVVDGRAKMILDEGAEPDEIRECASIIKNQAERMTVIIRQLLDFTRRPAQHISDANILFIIKQIFQLLHPMASRQKVSFSLHREESAEVIIRLDAAQIQQVLINLLMNSVQAMPDGGNVIVQVTTENVSPAERLDHQPIPHMNIRITDEGTGISQEDLEKIFTPFFTTKTVGTGTGLGLSIAHGIVEEHGGWIEVESKPGSGSSFSIYLPMSGREQAGS